MPAAFAILSESFANGNPFAAATFTTIESGANPRSLVKLVPIPNVV